MQLSLPDLELSLTTDRGVFSAERVDPGTRLLLQEAPHPTEAMGDVLDLGCGYGPIAVTLARRAPAARVWAVDVNERAVALCAENAVANDAERVHPVVVDDDGHPSPATPRTWRRYRACASTASGRTRRSASARPPSTGCSPSGSTASTPGRRPGSSCRRHLGRRLPRRLARGQGWATERLVSRAGYRLLEVSAR